MSDLNKEVEVNEAL